MSRRSARLFLATLLALTGLLALGASTAFAAPPGNDSFAGRTVIAALNFTDTINTSEATTDPADPGSCGGPDDLATVWYEITSATDIRIAADTFGSDYSAGINVFVGDPSDPSALLLIACGLPQVGFEAFAGETYFLMVAACCDGTNGGNLVLNVQEAPPPVEITLTVDPTGSVNPKTGEAIIHGTVACSGPADVSVDVNVRQRAGRSIIDGFGFSGTACDTEPTPWSAVVTSFNGLFAGGKADVRVFAFACGPFDCSFAEMSQEVKLTGNR